MPRLLRPHIPVSVRVQVAERQLRATLSPGSAIGWTFTGGQSGYLKLMLGRLFGWETPVALDHSPALQNREKVFKRGVHVAYKPDANDPAYLVYRTKDDHRVKTHVRGDRGQFSDTALAKREKRRLKRAAGRRRPKTRWASRPLRSRNTFERRA